MSWTTSVEGMRVAECARGCLDHMLGDGDCQPACKNEQCEWDSADGASDCFPSLYLPNLPVLQGQCANGCSKEMVGDGTCHRVCMNFECDWDSANGVSDCTSRPATSHTYLPWVFVFASLLLFALFRVRPWKRLSQSSMSPAEEVMLTPLDRAKQAFLSRFNAWFPLRSEANSLL